MKGCSSAASCDPGADLAPHAAYAAGELQPRVRPVKGQAAAHGAATENHAHMIT